MLSRYPFFRCLFRHRLQSNKNGIHRIHSNVASDRINIMMREPRYETSSYLSYKGHTISPQLSSSEIKTFEIVKLKFNVLLENIPQLILQTCFLIIQPNAKNSFGFWLSFSSSSLSIISALLAYRSVFFQ